MFAADNQRSALLTRLGRLRERCADAVARRQMVDPDPNDAFRGLYVSDAQATELAGGEAPEPMAGGIESGPGLLGLDPFDTELLVIAMAPDLDPRFEKIYGYLHDDVTRRRASVGLSLELAGARPTDAAARARLAPGAPLRASYLVVVEDDDRPVLTRSLRVPDMVSAQLLGDDRPDAALAPYRRLASRIPDLVGADALKRALPNGPLLVHLRDDPLGSGASYATTLLANAGLGAITVDVGAVPDDQLLEIPPIAVREAVLTDSGLVVLGLAALAARPGGVPIVRAFADAPVTVVAVGGPTWDPGWSRRVPLSLATPKIGRAHV